MISLHEHYGYKNDAPFNLDEEQKTILNKLDFSDSFKRDKNNEQLCFSLKYNKEKDFYKLDSSYIIGVNWIVKGKLPIYIQPKLNNENSEVDYLLMLFEALKEIKNLTHLDHLYTIDFSAPLIEIEQKQDVLSPLLVIEFLNILKQIVKKGLKKSYYTVTKNLNTKVKGKILVNQTVKKNHTKGKLQYNYCQFQEFGFNSIENRLLKKALVFSKAIIANHKSLNTAGIKQLVNFVSPAFSNISEDVTIKEVSNLKYNPFFKEYKPAIKTAKIILKKYAYNISLANNLKHKTPPFWIDMSKLFELYLFKKLKEVFPLDNEVIYHKKFNFLEPDFLLKSKDGNYKIIIDAKYKPRYEDGNILHTDAKQVSGYGRLKSIRKELAIKDNNSLTDILIIYTSNTSENENIIKDNLLEDDDDRYAKLYKYSIQIPKID